MPSAGAALRMRQARSAICSSVAEPASRASSCACMTVIAGPCATRFMLGGELQQDILHRLRALRPGRNLGLDAQPLRAGEPRGAAFLADEIDHLAAVERRVLDELELHRLV